MSAQPTPGQWAYEPIPADAYTDPDMSLARSDLFWIVDTAFAGEVLATVHQVSNGDARANARVLAAASDLLAALKAVRETCPADPDINPRWQAAWDAMVGAIARAEGAS